MVSSEALQATGQRGIWQRPRTKQRAYCYAYYFYCPRCHTVYLLEEAKRPPTR